MVPEQLPQVNIPMNQQEIDLLTDCLDVAMKHPELGGFKIFDKVSVIMSKLRQSVAIHQMREQALAKTAMAGLQEPQSVDASETPVGVSDGGPETGKDFS